MANGNSRIVVTEFSATFGGTTYGVKTAPCGAIETADLPDITTGADTVTRFAQASVTEDGDIQMTLAGNPGINTRAALSLSLKTSANGAAATAKTVNLGTAIATAVKPADITTDGDHVLWYDVTFALTGDRT